MVCEGDGMVCQSDVLGVKVMGWCVKVKGCRMKVMERCVKVKVMERCVRVKDGDGKLCEGDDAMVCKSEGMV